MKKIDRFTAWLNTIQYEIPIINHVRLFGQPFTFCICLNLLRNLLMEEKQTEDIYEKYRRCAHKMPFITTKETHTERQVKLFQSTNLKPDNHHASGSFTSLQNHDCSSADKQ